MAGGEGSPAGHSLAGDLRGTTATRQERRDPKQRLDVGNNAPSSATSRTPCRRSWAPAMGHRKPWLQRTGPFGLARRSCLETRPRCHRMLPAHDLSRIHPHSCLSLSQRETSPSSWQVQRFPGKSHGRGNLPILHFNHPVWAIRRIRPLGVAQPVAVKFASFSHPGLGVSHCSVSASLRPKNNHHDSPLPAQTRPSPRLHSGFVTISHAVQESLHPVRPTLWPRDSKAYWIRCPPTTANSPALSRN